MKRICIFLLCLCTLPAMAEVSVLSVTDEDKHSRKEDFYHTFEYFVQQGGHGKAGKCQATRIAPRWFVTAAHCVQDLCQKSCTVQMDLLEGSVSALASTHHTAEKPAVFVHPQYKSGKKMQIQYDLALIHLDVNRAPKTYYRRSKQDGEPNVIISKWRFFAWLETHRSTKSAYRHALSPSLPPIAVFDNANLLLDRNISVISIFHGVRQVKPNPYPVYYVKDLGYAYTQDFGIQKGMSGSGVMTNTGELIGIISASVGTDLYRNHVKIKHEDLFMFPVFNEKAVNFMKDVMGKDFTTVDQKDAYPYLTSKTHKDFSTLLRIMKQK